MDGQTSVAFALFVKALVIAAGAVTGVLGILIAFSFGVVLVAIVKKLVCKMGGVLKRSPKESRPSASQKEPSYV